MFIPSRHNNAACRNKKVQIRFSYHWFPDSNETTNGRVQLVLRNRQRSSHLCLLKSPSWNKFAVNRKCGSALSRRASRLKETFSCCLLAFDRFIKRNESPFSFCECVHTIYTNVLLYIYTADNMLCSNMQY